MKLFTTILITFIINIYVIAQDTKKEYIATRTNNPPKIDGILNDDTWKAAIPLTDMVQREPVYNSTPTQKTDARIMYDDNAIYVGVMYFDEHTDSIYHELSSRDDDNTNADRFYIGFDTYNRFDAYVFGVTASGVQFDYKDSDPTYDAVWESAVKINEKGWAIEMRIPYSAIRFPSVPEQEWGFQIIRMITRNKEYIQWAITPKTIANSRTLWGKLKGLKDIKPPLRLSMTPFVNIFYKNEPVINTNKTTTYNNSLSYNYGADLKYGIDEKYTLDVTLLPDFSQVQSDNKIKSLGYQEVVFNENRPFFKEGTELFNKNELFYSRRIGKTPCEYNNIESKINNNEKIIENPSTSKLLNAVKISGRNNNGLGMGFFNAITDNMYATIEDSIGKKRKILTEPLTNYNAVVLDQKLKNNSSFYFINTNVIRDKKYNDANVSGSGLTLMNDKNTWACDVTAALSQKYKKIDTLDNIFNTLLGYRYFLGARKISGNFQFGVSHTLINKTYDSRDMGYMVIGNRQKERLYASYNIFIPNSLYRETYNFVSFDYWTNPESDKSIYSNINLDNTTILLDYSSVNVGLLINPFESYDYYEPRVSGRFSKNYRNYVAYASYNSDSRKPFVLYIYGQYGDFIEKFKGYAYNANINLFYRINNKLQTSLGVNYSYNSYNIGYANTDDNDNIIYGGRKLVTYENTLNLKYVIKNDMSLNLITRHYWNTGVYKDYYTLKEDGNIILNETYNNNNDFSYNVFNVDLVYSWQFAPGSTISLVYKNFIETEEDVIISKFSRNLRNTLDAPQTNSISLKLLYYIDYQYLKKIRNKKVN